jgi:hypothetical protein
MAAYRERRRQAAHVSGVTSFSSTWSAPSSFVTSRNQPAATFSGIHWSNMKCRRFR